MLARDSTIGIPMERYLLLKIALGALVVLFLARLVFKWFSPPDPLDAASSALRDRLFSSIKRPWDD